jgi:3'(2'), 5'-bisphosphate nucleotidase
MDRPDLIAKVLEVAAAAGRAAMAFYGSSHVTQKADSSPLTLADTAAHEAIVSGLRALWPEIPILSEESPEPDSAARARWRRLWMVDPIDGTKEFIKQSEQFTVNIALIEDGEPVLGVIHAPVSGVSYAARKGGAAALVHRPGGAPQPIRTRRADPARIVIAASRDHAGPEVQNLLARFDGATTIAMGSALKFCLVAEGRADVYPRLLPTMEWDTAAGQCILEAAGGGVVDLERRRLAYNKREGLRNPGFVAFGDGTRNWPSLL